jgi:hypothetical protein
VPGPLGPFARGAAEFPAAESKDQPNRVAFVQEAPCPLQLHLEVVIVGAGTQLHLFDFHGVLLLPGLPGLLLLLVLVPSPVHDLDHRGSGLGRYLHQVQFGLGSSALRILEGDDAYLLAVGVDESNGADADVVVYSRPGNQGPPCSGNSG